MRCSLRITSIFSLLIVACGKSSGDRAVEVESCSVTSTRAPAIAQCLRQIGWSAAAAESAGRAQQHEVDSVQAEIGSLTARADSQHGGELQACDRRLVDLKSCLITKYGWDEDEATKTDDSLWTSRSAEHQQEIRACLGRRGVGTGACLQLYYKWLPRRALALDDSIRRANLQ
jgi:hypothetical protein